ncbi:unnamed protein product, partial [Discosporangium mesarthrocarpum]
MLCQIRRIERTDEKGFRCKTCDKTFDSASGLKYHSDNKVCERLLVPPGTPPTNGTAQGLDTPSFGASPDPVDGCGSQTPRARVSSSLAREPSARLSGEAKIIAAMVAKKERLEALQGRPEEKERLQLNSSAVKEQSWGR